MADTRRLVGKLDEAIKGLKPQRRQGIMDGIKLAQALRERLAPGRPIEISIGGRPLTVRPDLVRVSGTRVDLGTPCRTSIPLCRVQQDVVSRDRDGNDVLGPCILEGGRSIPVELR